MMKRSRYKFHVLQKNKYSVYALLLSIVLMFEIYLYYSLNYMQDKGNQQSFEEEKYIELDTVVNKIKENNLEILSIQSGDEGSYTIQVGIRGNKDEVCRLLQKLESCIIKDYELDVQANNIDGKVTLTYN